MIKSNKRSLKNFSSIFLALVMLITTIIPISSFAAPAPSAQLINNGGATRTVGQTFEVTVRLIDLTTTSGGQVSLYFDKAVVNVVNSVGNPVNTVAVFKQRSDIYNSDGEGYFNGSGSGNNTTGVIDYTLSINPDKVTEGTRFVEVEDNTFDLVTIRFKTIAVGNANIQFATPSSPAHNAGNPTGLLVGKSLDEMYPTPTLGTLSLTVVDPAADSTLSALSISTGTLVPTFSPGTIEYDVELPYATTTAPTITATASNGSTPVINVGAVPGSATVVVTATNTTTTTYTINYTKTPASTISTLSNLVTSAGTMAPTFSSGTLDYEVTLPAGTTTVPTITATKTDILSAVEVTNALDLDGTTVIEVTAENGDTTEYNVTFNVLPSTVATLSSITLAPNVGVISPAFSPDVIEYTVSLLNGTTVPPTVSATTTDSKATITSQVDATTVTPLTDPVTTPIASDKTTIVVEAEDGDTEKTYTITFIQAPIIQATGVTITTAASTITTDGGTLDLDATVQPSEAGQDVTWSVDDTSKATISSTTGVLTAVNNGTVIVTATSNVTTNILSTKTITITNQIDPIVSINASAPITVANATPIESVGLPTTVTVALTKNGTTTVGVTWDTSSYDSTVSGDYVFTGTLTGLPALISNPGSLTTSITVTVNQSSNAKLSGITLSTGTLSPAFSGDTESYTVILPYETTTPATVTGVKAHAAATISSTTQANTVAAYTDSTDAADTATIVVTAQDGTTKTYTISFKEAPPVDATGITFSPSAPTITSNGGTLTVTSTAVPNDAPNQVTWTIVSGSEFADLTSSTDTTATLTAKGNGSVVLKATHKYTTSISSNVTIAITGQQSAGLTGLSIDAEAFAESFAQNTLTYSATVTSTVYTVEVTPSAALGTITVNGATVVSGDDSSEIQLKPGKNIIQVIVTELNKTPKTYTIIVNKAYPYIIGNVTLNQGNDVSASVDITRDVNWTSGETVVVIFQLMRGTLPVSIVSREVGIGSDAITAEFTGMKGSGYSVNVLMWETLDSSKVHIGTNQAEPK